MEILEYDKWFEDGPELVLKIKEGDSENVELLRRKAIDFIEVYDRTGMYPDEKYREMALQGQQMLSDTLNEIVQKKYPELNVEDSLGLIQDFIENN